MIKGKKEKWQELLDMHSGDLHYKDPEEFVKTVDFAIDHILERANFAVPLDESTREAWKKIARSLRSVADMMEGQIKEYEEKIAHDDTPFDDTRLEST